MENVSKFEVGKTYSFLGFPPITIAKRTRGFIFATDGRKMKLRPLRSDEPNPQTGYLYLTGEFVRCVTRHGAPYSVASDSAECE